MSNTSVASTNPRVLSPLAHTPAKRLPPLAGKTLFGTPPNPSSKAQSPVTPGTAPPKPQKVQPVQHRNLHGQDLFSGHARTTVYTPVVLIRQGDERVKLKSPDTMRISLPKTTVDEPMDGHYYNFMNRKRPNNNMGLVLQARQNFMKRVSEISSMY